MTPILMGAELWAPPPAGNRASATRPTRAVETRRLHMIETSSGSSTQLEGSAFARQIIQEARMKAYTPQTFDHLKGLDGISDAQLAEHFKLYEGYVKQVNSLNEQLDEMVRKGKPSGTDPHFAELTRHLGFEYNGMILHEYYFSNLKRAADPTPSKGSGPTQARGQNCGGLGRPTCAPGGGASTPSPAWLRTCTSLAHVIT